jgi:hypothetical protein
VSYQPIVRPMTLHHCGAKLCGIRIPMTRLFCTRHWSAVPAGDRRELCELYAPGVDLNDQPVRFQVQAARCRYRLAVGEGRMTEQEARVAMKFVRRSLEEE